jgi:protein-S-isoprenylcysteine O-methyltransferase Ste14
MPIKRLILWRLTVTAAVVLAVVSFTPIVIPTGELEPVVLTLWAGILVAVLFVILTYLAGRIHPENWNPAGHKHDGRAS